MIKEYMRPDRLVPKEVLGTVMLLLNNGGRVFGNTNWTPNDIDIIISIKNWERCTLISTNHNPPLYPINSGSKTKYDRAENYIRVIPKDTIAYRKLLYWHGKVGDVIIVDNDDLVRDMLRAKISCDNISNKMQRHLSFEQYLLSTGRWVYVKNTTKEENGVT